MQAAASQEIKAKRLVLIDDHPIVRKGLRELLGDDFSFAICGEADNAQEALAVIRESHPDCAIVDVSLEGGNGISLIKRIKSMYPDLPCLVFSMHDETLYAERALKAGASGYVMKQTDPDNMIQALHKILDGDIYLSEKMSRLLVHKLISGKGSASGAGVDNLSDRELEIFQLFGRGLTSRQISEQLCISIKTTESHRARIKEKMQFSNSAELVQYAIKWVQSEMA